MSSSRRKTVGPNHHGDVSVALIISVTDPNPDWVLDPKYIQLVEGVVVTAENIKTDTLGQYTWRWDLGTL